MALIKDGKVCVIVGIVINIVFIILKFVVYLLSHLNLFFADAIDSFVDGFVIFLVLIFLRFDFEGKLTYLNMDIMLFSQWCAIIVFRVVIFLEQIGDLIAPDPRAEPLLLIIVSSIVLAGSIVIAILFVDEDDVIKCFIGGEEKRLMKLWKTQNPKKPASCKLQPIFAEALDNLVTTLISLIIGILLYFEVLTDYLYLIDDISNMCISAVMCLIACRSLWQISLKYTNKSYFKPMFM